MDNKWQELSRPFNESEIEWRFQRAGMSKGKPWAMVLAYISFPAVVKRFNEVFGPGNWQNEHYVASNGAYICRIGVKNDDGEWIWKSNGSDETKVEAVKGGFSTALKRTAAMWGVGLYLYDLGDSWAEFTENGRFRDRVEKGGSFLNWNPPALPDWALSPEDIEFRKKVADTDKKKDTTTPEWDAMGWFIDRFKKLRSGDAMIKAVLKSIEDKTLDLVFRKHIDVRDLLQAKWQALRDAGKLDKAGDFGVFLIERNFTPPRAEIINETPATAADVKEMFGKPTVPQPLAKDIQTEMDKIRAGMKIDGNFVNWDTFDKFLQQTAGQQEITREALIKKMVKAADTKKGKTALLKAMVGKYLTYLEREFTNAE